MLKRFYVASPQSGTLPTSAADLTDPNVYGTINVTGIRRPEADAYLGDMAGVDASHYSGMTVKSREIRLNLDAQNNTQLMALYRLVPYKQKRRFWAATETGTYWIDGYALGIEGDELGYEISSLELPIICPYPWWRSAECHEITASGSVSVSQSGDIEAGLQLVADNVSAANAVTAVKLSDANGRCFEATWSGSTGDSAVILDTTPGIRYWKKSGLQSLSVAASGTPIVPAGGASATVSCTASGLKLKWFDTYSGI